MKDKTTIHTHIHDIVALCHGTMEWDMGYMAPSLLSSEALRIRNLVYKGWNIVRKKQSIQVVLMSVLV